MTTTTRTIAIIGAGFSGVCLAVHLLRHASSGDRILLFEKSSRLGRGAAYGTEDPNHLLNVRAATMGAYDDDPRGFLTWLNSPDSGDISPLRRPVSPEAFVPRLLYGRYLEHCLREALPAPDSQVQFQPISGEVVDIVPMANCLLVQVRQGACFAVDEAVLALGNMPPDRDDLPRYAGNPWGENSLRGLEPTSDVLIIGTGLTMADTVLSLLGRGHEGRIHAVSRHGLLPRVRIVEGREAWWPLAMPLPQTCVGLLRAARAAARQAVSAGQSWEEIVDALRPHVRRIWHDLPLAERRRFLRHLRPWWEVHRHRIPPEAAAQVERAIRSGKLRIMAGHIEGERPCEGGAEVQIRRRGSKETVRLEVARIINCSGPKTDYAAESPLLSQLFSRGHACMDPLGLGLHVACDGAVLDRSGLSSDRLFAVGPLTRGTHFEITAVPEIRSQCATLARRLMGCADDCWRLESRKPSSKQARSGASPFQNSA